MEDVLVERTVVESGRSGKYKSIVTNEYVTMDGTNVRHPCCPVVTTSSSGTLPNIQPQSTATSTETATTSGTGTTAEYVIRSGLSYADYLIAADILAQIAAGGASVMDYDHSQYIQRAEAVNQTTVITTTDVSVNGVTGAIIPVVPPGAPYMPVGSQPVAQLGFVNMAGTTGTAANSPLPRADGTHLQDALSLPTVGANTVQVGPSTFIPKITANPGQQDMLNDYSNLSDAGAPAVMDSTAVSNDQVTFVNNHPDLAPGAANGRVGSRVLNIPLR